MVKWQLTQFLSNDKKALRNWVNQENSENFKLFEKGTSDEVKKAGPVRLE